MDRITLHNPQYYAPVYLLEQKECRYTKYFLEKLGFLMGTIPQDYEGILNFTVSNDKHCII